MRFSKKTNFLLICLLIFLNIILRFQAVPRELGIDSFIIHMIINSLNEYGYAKWILHPLSIAGLYPFSFSSSAPFLLSDIQQITLLDMNNVIFLYDIFLGTLIIFTGYLMARVIFNDDFFSFLVAFFISTIPANVISTTWTIGTRPLLVTLAPILIYFLYKRKISFKIITLIVFLILFLFSTHHLVYFLIPVVIIFFIIKMLFGLKVEIPKNILILIPILFFMLLFSIPFVFKKFLEEGSRFQFIVPDYVRYMGPLIIYSFSGIIYLIFKQKKSFNEWFLLLSTISLTPFIYITTYMKWFVPIFLVPIACIALINITNKNQKRFNIIVIIVLISVIFSGFYQFVHVYEQQEPYDNRYIEDSTYNTGLWIKKFVKGNTISNDRILSFRIFSVSETTHFLVPLNVINQIYGFIEPNVSLYRMYPYSSEQFWFSGYEGPDLGESTWEGIHRMTTSFNDFDIEYVVENNRGNGNIIWHHPPRPSELIELSHNNNLLYDNSNIKIWWIKDIV